LIYFYNPFKRPIEILQMPVTGGSPANILTLPNKNYGNITLSPDRTFLLCVAVENKSDVWLMENFDPESELEIPIKSHKWEGLEEHSFDQAGMRLLYQQKKYHEAEKIFRQGFELNSKHPGLLRGLAHSLRFLGRHEEAKAVYQKGLKIQPDDIAMLDGLGSIYSSQQNYELAEPIYRKILSLDYPGAGISGEGILGAYIPGATWRIKYLSELAISLFYQEKYNDAQRYAEKAVSLDSSFVN
jgi:tetratricopeptide (TPR) repeat protein